MVDIHCHILPYTDDGPIDIGESIKMAKTAEANGIKVIVATPHYIDGEGYKNCQYNLEILNSLKNELLKRGVSLEILLGNEVFITPNIIELLDRNEVTTINRTKFILIELPIIDIPGYIEQIIFDLRLKGLYPIIAHPERNFKIIENPNLVYYFIERGALIQLNLASLEKGSKDKVGRTANILLECNMVHFIASDAHSSNKYNLSQSHAFEIMSRYTSQENIMELLYENPRKVINNENLVFDEPIKHHKKSIFISKFFHR